MTLNRAQRIIVGIGGCLVLFALLFPPLVQRGDATAYCDSWFIFFPQQDWCVVNTLPLFLQIAAIVTGTALLVWWFHSHQAITQSPPEKTSERGIVQRFRRMNTRLRFLLLITLFLGLLVFFKAMYSNP